MYIMKKLTINHAAVWVSVVLLSVLGFVWYGVVFDKQWMAYEGLDLATIEANPPGEKIWISNIIATVIPVYTLAWLFVKLDIESWMEGAKTGLIIAFSFVFLTIMISNMFAQAPYGLSWINGGNALVSLTLTGAVLGAWRKYV